MLANNHVVYPKAVEDDVEVGLEATKERSNLLHLSGEHEQRADISLPLRRLFCL